MNKLMFTRLGASTSLGPDVFRLGTLGGLVAACYGMTFGVLVGVVWDVHGQGGQEEKDRCMKGYAELPWVPTLPPKKQPGFCLE
jgi:hypothetical protein